MYKGMNYINGQWVNAREDFASVNPAFETQIGLFPVTNQVEVLDAYLAARAAFDGWRKVSRVKRAEYFYKLANLLERSTDRLVQAIYAETGKNKNECLAEVNEALHMCQVVAGSGRQPYGSYYASEIAEKDAYTIRKPKGVVAVISPWNFPLAIGSFWTTAVAIAEGNTVVHKPSELTPIVAQVAAELYHEAGFPAGVYNLIHGAGQTGSWLVDAPVNTVLFTGSAEVGQIIKEKCAKDWKKNCAVETGSKSAVIVFEDADLDLAMDACIASAYKLSGQRCVSAGRLLVQRSIVDMFTEKFVAKSRTIRNEIGNLQSLTGEQIQSPTAYFGPLISREAKERVQAYNEMVRRDADAIVYLNGELSDKVDATKGYYLGPFVYRTEWFNNKRYLKEEVFGPHVAIIPFDTVDDAIRIYNDTPYALALGVVTNDFRKMRRIREDADAGMIYFNGGSIAAESHLPFGGTKMSGSGGKTAAGTYRSVTDEVAVTVNYGESMIFAQGLK